MCASCHSFDGRPRKDLDYVLPPVSNYPRQRLLYHAPLAPVFPRSSCYLHNRTPYSAVCMILAFSLLGRRTTIDPTLPLQQVPATDQKGCDYVVFWLSGSSLDISGTPKTGALLPTLFPCQTTAAPQLCTPAPSQARKNHADPRLERA
jgi:hypothetical protein